MAGENGARLVELETSDRGRLVSESETSDFRSEGPGQPLQYLANGLPRNPRGRTGLQGRGVLRRWGPNTYVEPIVTRYHPDRADNEFKSLQVLVLVRRDTGAIDLPGKGVLLDGTSPWRVLAKHVSNFFCDSGCFVGEGSEEARAQLLANLKDRNQAFPVHLGYRDDPRNTDNAWVESFAWQAQQWRLRRRRQ